jgi:hypothetical protein
MRSARNVLSVATGATICRFVGVGAVNDIDLHENLISSRIVELDPAQVGS